MRLFKTHQWRQLAGLVGPEADERPRLAPAKSAINELVSWPLALECHFRCKLVLLTLDGCEARVWDIEQRLLTLCAAYRQWVVLFVGTIQLARTHGRGRVLIKRAPHFGLAPPIGPQAERTHFQVS